MTRPEDLTNGIARIADDDAEARRLRANLAVFARQTDDPDTTRLVNDVLAGRRDLREVLASPAFRRASEAKMDILETGLRRLPPLERERVLDGMRRGEGDRTDEQQIASLRERGLRSSPLDADGEVDRV